MRKHACASNCLKIAKVTSPWWRRSGVALGGHAGDHDLSQLSGERLRSHGGLAEQVVPFILSHPLKAGRVEGGAGKPLRNYDVFSVLLNDVKV